MQKGQKGKTLMLTWLVDLEWRNIHASGLLDELSRRFENILVVGSTKGSDFSKISLPKNVALHRSRWLFADPILERLAAICTVYYVCRDTRYPDYMPKLYRRTQPSRLFLAKNFFWIIRPLFLILLFLRTVFSLPLLLCYRPSLLLTQTFIWSPYDNVLGLYAKLTGIRWISIVTSWDNTTNKGEFHLKPDKILVWGEQNVVDGQALLRMPKEKIIPLPPPHFTCLRTVAEETNTDRRKHILYIGTTPSNYKQQHEFVRALVAMLLDMGITERFPLVLRPHPNDSEAWAREFVGIPGVIVDTDTQQRTSQWSVFSTDREALENYYRLLRDSLVVVNMYSTATVEAGLLRVPSIAPRIFFPPEKQFYTIHDGLYHTRELRKSPGVTPVESMADLRLKIMNFAENEVDSRLLDEHFRICEFISKFPPEDLLRRYSDVIASEIEV